LRIAFLGELGAASAISTVKSFSKRSQPQSSQRTRRGTQRPF